MAQKPEDSSPNSQQFATGPYPEPVKPSSHTPEPVFLRFIPIPSFHLRLGLPSGSSVIHKPVSKQPAAEWGEYKSIS
jgi:hypothetical protein